MALPTWYVNTKDVLSDIWDNAGTKLLGWLMMAVGALATLDASTIDAIQTWLGPKYGKYFAYVCLMAAGYMVRQRGSRNTADIANHIINRANSGDPAATTAVAAATSNAVAASDKVLLVKSPATPAPSSTESKS